MNFSNKIYRTSAITSIIFAFMTFVVSCNKDDIDASQLEGVWESAYQNDNPFLREVKFRDGECEIYYLREGEYNNVLLDYVLTGKILYMGIKNDYGDDSEFVFEILRLDKESLKVKGHYFGSPTKTFELKRKN